MHFYTEALGFVHETQAEQIYVRIICKTFLAYIVTFS